MVGGVINWTELDDAIVEVIDLNYGACPANSMMLGMLAKKMRPFSIGWRVVDNRLKVLRKQGRIKLDSKRKWVAL